MILTLKKVILREDSGVVLITMSILPDTEVVDLGRRNIGIGSYPVCQHIQILSNLRFQVKMNGLGNDHGANLRTCCYPGVILKCIPFYMYIRIFYPF